jgi:hypothetical protein
LRIGHYFLFKDFTSCRLHLPSSWNQVGTKLEPIDLLAIH